MLGASILSSSVLTLLIPMATYHTVWALVGIRVVEGLVQVSLTELSHSIRDHGSDLQKLADSA